MALEDEGQQGKVADCQSSLLMSGELIDEKWPQCMVLGWKKAVRGC